MHAPDLQEIPTPYNGLSRGIRRLMSRSEDPVFRFLWSCFKWVLGIVACVGLYAGKDFFFDQVAATPAVVGLQSNQLQIRTKAFENSKKIDDATARLDAQAVQNAQAIALLAETAKGLQEIKVGQAAVLAQVGFIQQQQVTDRQSIENRLNAIASRQIKSQ